MPDPPPRTATRCAGSLDRSSAAADLEKVRMSTLFPPSAAKTASFTTRAVFPQPGGPITTVRPEPLSPLTGSKGMPPASLVVLLTKVARATGVHECRWDTPLGASVALG